MSNILKQADAIVHERAEEKERQYGPFAESMERASVLFNAMSPKGEAITTEGMYRALIALKLSRMAYSYKEDTLLDAVAYLGALNDFVQDRPQNQESVALKIGSIIKQKGTGCCYRVLAIERLSRSGFDDCDYKLQNTADDSICWINERECDRYELVIS